MTSENKTSEPITILVSKFHDGPVRSPDNTGIPSTLEGKKLYIKHMNNEIRSQRIKTKGENDNKETQEQEIWNISTCIENDPKNKVHESLTDKDTNLEHSEADLLGEDLMFALNA